EEASHQRLPPDLGVVFGGPVVIDPPQQGRQRGRQLLARRRRRLGLDAPEKLVDHFELALPSRSLGAVLETNRRESRDALVVEEGTDLRRNRSPSEPC